MNNSGLWLIPLLALAVAAPLNAQQGTAPPNHRVQSLHSGLKWTVEITPPLPQSGAAKKAEPPATSRPSIREIKEENSMGPDLRKQTTFYSEGEPLTRYALGDMVLYASAQTHEIEIEPSNYELPGGSLSPKHFEEFTWINARNYQGVEKVNDRPCDVYRQPWSFGTLDADPISEEESAPPQPASTPSTSLQVVAYIDQKTRLPARLETPLETRTYLFSPDSDPVILPTDFQKEWTDRLARIEKRKNRFKIPQ